MFDPTKDHISDDHDEEREDTKLLLNFCDVQRQLIQTHNSILTLYKEEQGSGEEPWKGKSKELVRSMLSWVKQVTVDCEFLSHTRARLGCRLSITFCAVCDYSILKLKDKQGEKKYGALAERHMQSGKNDTRSWCVLICNNSLPNGPQNSSDLEMIVY